MKPANDQEPIRLTVRNGGWVLIVTALFSATLLTWALWGVVMRRLVHNPGDGRTVESYAFDLTDLRVPRDELIPVLKHRDILPRWDFPPVVEGTDIDAINRAQRGKLLVPTDLVIGVEVNGSARAYPIRVMNVHEIINDTLGETPIAVTYNWQCDSVRVFDRHLNGETLTFAHSGLFRNSNTLMYDETPPMDEPGEMSGETTSGTAGAAPADESLFQQITGGGVSGGFAGEQLTILPSTLTSWSAWLALHPSTSVIRENAALTKRYNGAYPSAYFLIEELSYPVSPLPTDSTTPLKTQCVSVEVDGVRRVFPIPLLLAMTADRSTASVNGVEFAIFVDQPSHSVRVERVADQPPLDDVLYAVWFAQHAFWPEAEFVHTPAGSTAD
jgi:hypothetical protein